VLTRFLPRRPDFYAQFRMVTGNAAEATAILVDLVEHAVDAEPRKRRLRDLEHRGDELTHQIFASLASALIVPIGREAVQALAGALDDFVDAMDEAGTRLVLYRLERPPDAARGLARIIRQQADAVVQTLSRLEDAAHDDAVFQRVRELHRLETEADDLHADALATVYDGATDVPAVARALRWGEIYRVLEEATDHAERVADLIEEIASQRH
jgi:hypothetical protein